MKVSRTGLTFRKTGDLLPLLILGDGRSGTTLLMQLLGTSREVIFDRVPPFEVRYLTYLVKWALLLQQQWTPNGDWNPALNFQIPGRMVGPFPFSVPKLWNGEEMARKCFVAAWKEFSRIAIDKSFLKRPKRSQDIYFAEKSPQWLPEALRPMVPYHVILIVRDPRDVFLSITAFDKKRGYPGFSRLADDDDWTFARRFVVLRKRLFDIIRKEEQSPRCLLLKYEDMAVGLDRTAEQLGEFLNVKLDPKLVERRAPDFSYHMTSENPRASLARWRSELSADLNDFFKDKLVEEMRHFGYLP